MICEYKLCNKEHNGEYGSGKYCSLACSKKGSRQILIKFKVTICQCCHKEFKQKNWQKRIYCTKECSNKNPKILKFNKFRKGKTLNALYGQTKAKEVLDKKKTSILNYYSNMSTEDKIALSQKRKETAIKYSFGGYRKNSGYGKCGWYKGYWCQSTYELVWVIYHLDHNIEFKRNDIAFDYVFKDKNRKYYPDFIIGDTYIEIKGYYTEETFAKIDQFKHNLIVLDKQKMKYMFDYVNFTYGKNIVGLYE